MGSEKEKSFSNEVDSTLENLFDENSLEEDIDLPDKKDKSLEKERDFDGDRKTEKSFSPDKKYSENGNVSAQNTDANNVVEDFTLDNLNAILLSLEWEISNEVIENYLSEIKRLKGCSPDGRYCDYFLKILENLGLYIKKNLLNANPETVGMMQSVQQNLEMISMKPDLREKDKKTIFYNEYNNYLKFKKKIGARKSVEKKPPVQYAAKGETFAESFTLKVAAALKIVLKEELDKMKHEIIEALKEK